MSEELSLEARLDIVEVGLIVAQGMIASLNIKLQLAEAMYGTPQER